MKEQFMSGSANVAGRKRNKDNENRRRSKFAGGKKYNKKKFVRNSVVNFTPTEGEKTGNQNQIKYHAFMRLPYQWRHKIQAFFMIATLIVPMRIIFSGIVMFITSCIAFLATFRIKHPNQVPNFYERILQSMVLIGVRIQLFIIGVHYIHVDRKNHLSKIIVANHVTVLDAFVMSWVDNTRSVLNQDAFAQPIAGTIFKALQYLQIHENEEGANAEDGQKLIKQTLTHEHPYPILIFPQYICSRPDIITWFQNYPFLLPNEYVTPLALNWNRYSPFTPWLAPQSPWIHYMTLCCNFDNSVSVVYGDPIKPDGPVEVFKEEIRTKMGTLLKAAITNHSHADYKLLMKVESSNIHVSNLECICVNDWLNNHRISAIDIYTALNEFAVVDKDGSGYIDFIEFCDYFTMDPNKLKTLLLFRALDDTNSLTIEFNEFLTAYAMSRKSIVTMVPLLANMLDVNSANEIKAENIRQIFPDDPHVADFSSQLFEGKENPVFTQKEFEEAIKDKCLESGVEFIITNIFKQSHNPGMN